MSKPVKHRANKSLGQHFLHDQHAIQRIVTTIPEGASVVEIGPGPGAITKALLQRVGALTVIEKDDRFAELWQQEMTTHQGLQVVHGDVLQVLHDTMQAKQPEWVAGNLPYNISGPLTAQLANHAVSGGMLLMYQREVGNRIMADPGSKTYGGLSVLVRHHYRVTRVLLLPPGAFSPPPKVHSVVLLFAPHGNVPKCSFARLQQVVRHGFAHRRKTILNNFKGYLTKEDFVRLSIDAGDRPERLDYDAWVRLALDAEDWAVPLTV